MSVGSQVHASMQNFSPGRRIPYDARSRQAVARIVRKTRAEVLQDRVPGITLDGSEGSMNRLADSISLVKLLKRHNDPADSYHMDEHEVVCVGHQFSDGVRFMSLTTPHLLLNMARAKNCGWQAQGHFDAAFNWCGKEIALIGFGMNSMGAHFNPVSVSIANSESKEGIENAYKATCSGLYTVFNSAKLCEGEKCDKCGFCTQVLEQVSEPDPAAPKGSIWNKHLLSIDAGNMHYQLDNPSSDNSKAFFATAKQLFGEDTKVGQCGHHVSCNIYYLFTVIKISISQSDMSVFLQPLHGASARFGNIFPARRISRSSTSIVIVCLRLRP
jgi:hypothetical protein